MWEPTVLEVLTSLGQLSAASPLCFCTILVDNGELRTAGFICTESEGGILIGVRASGSGTSMAKLNEIAFALSSIDGCNQICGLANPALMPQDDVNAVEGWKRLQEKYQWPNEAAFDDEPRIVMLRPTRIDWYPILDRRMGAATIKRESGTWKLTAVTLKGR